MRIRESRIFTNKHNEKIQLKTLLPEDVSVDYVNWLNDSSVNKYIESRFSEHDLESTKAFVDTMLLSEKDALMGVFCNESHAGNIKIGNIHPIYRQADVGLLIGKPYWNRGIGTIAIMLAEEIAVEQLELHKIYSGVYSDNIGSKKAFIKNKWRLVGNYVDHGIIDGQYMDAIILEKILE